MKADKRIRPTRVVFVEPRGTQLHVLDPLKTIPMMGPLYLGTLAAQAGYDVAILNEHLLGRSVRDNELADVDILCLSCMTATVVRGREIAKQYQKLRHTLGRPSRTIMGGVHATLLPEDVMDDVDQVFVGEAESHILDLLSGKRTERIIHGEPSDHLDDLPLPDYTLLKNWQKLEALPIISARGCRSDCHACSVTETAGNNYRARHIDRVWEEVRHSGYRRLFFVDDHFAVNKERARVLIDKIKGIDRKLVWSCQLRAETADDPVLIKEIRNAGCRSVYIGFEPIRGQDQKDRRASFDGAKRAIQVFKKAGIRVHGVFLLGADSDDKAVFKATSDFCRKSGLASVQYQALTPLPGTRFYQQVEREGRLLHKNWQFYDAMHVVFQPKHVTPVELQQGVIDCFNDFYSYTNAVHDALNTFFVTLETLIKRAAHTRVYYPSWIPPLLKLDGKRMIRQWVTGNKTYLGYLSGMAQHADLSHWYQFLCPWSVDKTPNDTASSNDPHLDLFCNPLERDESNH